MNKRLWRMSSLISTVILTFLSCENETESSNSQENPYTDLVGTKISKATVWNNDTTVNGKFYVLPGASLTIKEGVTVKFAYHNDIVDNVGAIITLAGDGSKPSGQLIANGSATKPIILTSSKATPEAGDWGGVILIGEGKTNLGGQGAVEGLPSVVKYGGENNSDNSGSMKYVRIEYCGFGIAPDSEINGLSFYAVGNATTIDYVQVHKCTDDGFEWFGGAVSATHLVSSHNDDDSFDMDEGWQGTGQFWLAVQAPGADNGFESDGRKTLGSGTATNPSIYNVTLVGFGAGKDSKDKNYGMRLREDFEGDLGNFIITNFAGINWKLESKKGDDTDATSGNFDNGKLKIKYASYSNNSLDNDSLKTNFDGFNTEADESRFTSTENNVSNESVNFENAASGDYRLATAVLVEAKKALSTGTTPPAGFSQDATYRGAFGSTNWAANWTNWQ